MKSEYRERNTAPTSGDCVAKQTQTEEAAPASLTSNKNTEASKRSKLQALSLGAEGDWWESEAEHTGGVCLLIT